MIELCIVINAIFNYWRETQFNFIQIPLPSTPQPIKLESKTQFANGNARISPHTFSWQRPEKSPSAALSPADLFDFRPLDLYFVWKNPLYRCVSTYLYVLKKKTGGGKVRP